MVSTEIDMNPVDWGWKVEDNRFVPAMTNKTAATESLLQMVYCNCKTTVLYTLCSLVEEDMACLACRLVDHVRLNIVKICIIKLYGRKTNSPCAVSWLDKTHFSPSTTIKITCLSQLLCIDIL